MDEKHNLLENLRKFSKIFKNFLRKLQKCIILAYFSENLINHALNFCAFDEKRKWFGNCEKILKIFVENSIDKWHFKLFLENLLLKIELSVNITIFIRGGQSVNNFC